MEKKPIKLVEIARSFSYKLALPGYSNVDFFCSQKCEVPEEEAEKKSEELYIFCRSEVKKSVSSFLKEQKEKKESTNTKSLTKQENYNRRSKLDDLRLEQLS